MRDIKFRAKGLDNEWMYGSIIHITEVYCDEEDAKECDLWDLVTEDGVEFKTKAETIGQFTGAHDSTGKEIYEGDILKLDEYTNGVVVYLEKDGMYGFYFKYDDGDDGTEPFSYYCLDEMEVLGNEFDNPELLGE